MATGWDGEIAGLQQGIKAVTIKKKKKKKKRHKGSQEQRMGHHFADRLKGSHPSYQQCRNPWQG